MKRRLNPALALALLLGLFGSPLLSTGTPSVTAQSEPDEETMGLLAAVRYCVDAECTAREGSVDGATVVFTSEDGTVEYGSCETVANAAPDGCSVQVPIDVPVAVTVDESTIPEGSTAFESTIVTTVTDEPGFSAVTFGLFRNDDVPPDADGVFSGSIYACTNPAIPECGDAVPDADVFLANSNTDNVVFATTDSSGDARFDLGRFTFDQPSPVTFGVILGTYPNGEIVDYDIDCVANGVALPFRVAEGNVSPGGPTLEVQFEATAGDDLSCHLQLSSGATGGTPAEAPEEGAEDEAEITEPRDGPGETVSGELIGLGLTFEEFQAIYGEGEQIDPVDSLWEFPNPEFDGFTLFASFPDGLTGHIEFGYEEADPGGLPVEEIAGQVDTALPSDATLVESYTVSAPTVGEPTLRVERYESALLGEVADGRTGILVGYQEQQTEPDPETPAGTMVTRVTVTIPTANDGTREATGDPGGIGLSEGEWEAVYGDGSASQGGVVYDNVTFPEPGFDIIAGFEGPDATITSLRFDYEEGTQLGGVSREDVFTQQVDSLPPDAVFQGSYYLPPTPEGPIGIIIDRWESDSLAGSTGTSGSILVVTQHVSAQQNPGSPPVLVVPRMDIVIAA